MGNPQKFRLILNHLEGCMQARHSVLHSILDVKQHLKATALQDVERAQLRLPSATNQSQAYRPHMLPARIDLQHLISAA